MSQYWVSLHDTKVMLNVEISLVEDGILFMNSPINLNLKLLPTGKFNFCQLS